ncbi:unnamed protein product [Trichobilharzia regenti]|uniref:NepR domain-containing protein n=1 Tax=Trichobilharzia regenti TaxID=157069 RepID=A0A183WE52_TRIRE|nr:unnamed protein product [Trichobilharzia regenti]VDQ06285.1 unnamed protein product [Trichobilharzia regenti]
MSENTSEVSNTSDEFRKEYERFQNLIARLHQRNPDLCIEEMDEFTKRLDNLLSSQNDVPENASSQD